MKTSLALSPLESETSPLSVVVFDHSKNFVEVPENIENDRDIFLPQIACISGGVDCADQIEDRRARLSRVEVIG